MNSTGTLAPVNETHPVKSMDEVIIRPAVARDTVNIAKILGSAWEKGPIKVLRVNEAKAIRWIMDTIENSFCLVAELSGRLLGTVAFTPIQPAFTDDWIMVKSWYYASPLTRHRERILTDLLVAAETFMDGRRMVMRLDLETDALLPTGFSDGVPNRRGYTQIGGAAYLRAPLAVQRDETSRLQAEPA